MPLPLHSERCRQRTAALLACVALVCIPIRSTWAQRIPAAADSVLNLPAALRLAADHSPALQRANAQADIELGGLQSVAQWPNPTLEYRRENLGAPILPDEFVTAYVPIDLTGRRLRLGQATDQARLRVAYQRQAARRDVELEITRRWVAATLAVDLLRTVREQQLAVEEIARVDAQRAREGVVAEAIAMRSRVESNRLAHDVTLAESRASRARYELATIIGVASDQLSALPGIDAGTALLGGALLDSDAALLARAERDRPEFLAASVAIAEATLRRRAERTGLLGDWQLQGGTKRTSGFMTGQVGLAVPLPLFHQNSGARLQTRGAEVEAMASRRELALQLTGEVLASADELRRLQRLGEQLQQTPRLAEDITTSARVSYAEGHMSLLELLDAHRAAADARRTMQQFYADLYLARAALARAIGASFVPENSP